MKRFYLVQAVLRTNYGRSKSKHQIVTATDPIGAARAMFDELPTAQRIPKKSFPEYFKVYPERDRETFMEEVGGLKIEEEMDEDTRTPYDAVCDMFEATAIEVRL